jgi:diguanylate cyclase (GGDEF)-like protein
MTLMPKPQNSIFSLAIAFLLVFWTATGVHAETLPPELNGNLQKVRVQLKWTHQFQFAGFYAAIEQGFFKDAGLDVELIAGGPRIDPADVVVSGNAEFGVGNSSLLIDFNAGRPVVAVAAILQHSPFVILARLDPAIRSVRDLEGKTLMGETHSMELLAYLKTAGIALDRVKLVEHTGTAMSLRSSGADRVDAMTAYMSTEPFEAARQNIPYQIFNPRDLNINFYGDTLFTSRQLAQQQPKTVLAMRDALIAGWRYALAHQSETVDLIIQKYQPKMNRTELTFEAQATYNLFQTDIVDIGYMSRERWQHIGNTYAASGMMPRDFNLDGFLFSSEEALPAWVYHALLWGSLAIVLAGILAAYIASLNLRLASSLKTLGAQAEKLEEANNELARLSATDPLTGLFNRRYFDETLVNEWNRACRSQSSLSLLMIDVDNFKKYNDALGHPAGDLCLKKVAEVLHNNAQRSGEFAARIGGEEFAVVTSNSGTPEAVSLAERILRDIADLKIPHPGSAYGFVTVSIGVSTLEHCPGQSHVQLINEADMALYRAKQEGRNCCLVHSR